MAVLDVPSFTSMLLTLGVLQGEKMKLNLVESPPDGVVSLHPVLADVTDLQLELSAGSEEPEIEYWTIRTQYCTFSNIQGY